MYPDPDVSDGPRTVKFVLSGPCADTGIGHGNVDEGEVLGQILDTPDWLFSEPTDNAISL
ncbi:hypothetical protein [Bradyrhizobium sp. DASA03007]|uniref:hypothetical protein n=1 Tax=unclassified Bradyrhizobium TaxID=2631580 RepID=UPI003F70EB75